MNGIVVALGGSVVRNEWLIRAHKWLYLDAIITKDARSRGSIVSVLFGFVCFASD